jgi:hypothetical protein
MIQRRGTYTATGVAMDFIWRLLDHITYVLPLLIQLVEIPGVLPSSNVHVQPVSSVNVKMRCAQRVVEDVDSLIQMS